MKDKELKAKRKIWVSVIGWAIYYGFIYNLVIQPVIQTQVIDWEYLFISLGLILGFDRFRGKNDRKN